MDQVLKIRDSFAWYLSPAANRRRTIMSSTPDSELSTVERTVRAVTEPKKLDGKAGRAERVTKKYLSPSDTKRSREAHDDDSYEGSLDEDLNSEDGEVDIADDGEPEVGTRAKIERPRGDDDDYQDEGVSDEEDVVSSVDGGLKVAEYLRNQSEAALLEVALKEIEDGQDWHDGERFLLRKLNMRGHEPLLPSHWSRDFRTCPEILFSSDADQVFLNSRSGKEFRASTALSSLVTLGSRVRDLRTCSLPQEKAIKKEIEKYLKWAEGDGGISRKIFIPILSITAGKPNQALSDLSAAATAQLDFLAQQHREYSTDFTPPLLYGIIITRCVIVFVTMDSSIPSAELRTIAHFDFSDRDMDVWNGFAVAILICIVRNYLMDHIDEMESEEEVSDDPDL